MPRPKKKTWIILRDDGSYMHYDFLPADVRNLFDAAEAGKKFARTSIGLIRLDNVNHIVEFVPPKEEPKQIPDVPALPWMSDDEMKEVLKIHLADQPEEVIEQWLDQIKGQSLM